MWQLPCYQSLRPTVPSQLHKSSTFCLQVLIYHQELGFKPNFDVGLGHYISLIYSKSATTVSLEQFRRSVHTSFLLPLDRPLLRRANRVTFPSPGATGAKLPNVHRGLETKHGLAGSNVQVALVQGDYDYHHYMQVAWPFEHMNEAGYMYHCRIILMMMVGVVPTDHFKPLYPGLESRCVHYKQFFLGKRF